MSPNPTTDQPRATSLQRQSEVRTGATGSANCATGTRGGGWGWWLTAQTERGEGGVLLESGCNCLPRRVPEVVICKRSGRVVKERWLQLGGGGE